MPRPKNGNFPCLTCGEVFSCQSLLASHLAIHYSGESGFICPVCSRRCNNYQHLQRHCLTHSDVKNYSCDECGKSFNRPDVLKGHKRAMHSGIKPHVCTICGRRFAESDDLKTHSTVHSRAKNHKCGKCGKTFTTAYSRKKHEKKCEPLNYVQTMIQPLPGGKVVTSTAHVMPISSTLVATVAKVVTSNATATVTTYQHLGAGATVTTFSQKSTAVTARQQSGTTLNPQEDALLGDINQIINDDNAGSLVGSQSGLPNNTDPTTWISFDATGSGYDIDLGCKFDGIPD